MPSSGLYVPYLCPAGHWTIGYGRLVARTHPAITHDEARAFLTLDTRRHAAQALRLSPGLAQAGAARAAAVVSFVFNLGQGAYAASTLRKRVDAGDWQGAADQAMRWVYGGGKVLRGLVLRRAAEAALLRDGYVR